MGWVKKFSLGWDLPFQNLRIWIACVKHVWIHLDLKCHVVLGGFPESESITIFYSTRNWKRLVKIRNQPFAPLELCHPKRVWRGCWISMVFCTWWLLLPTTWECTLPPLFRMLFLRLNLELDDEHRWTVCSGWLFKRLQQHTLHNSFQSKLIQIHPCAPDQQRLFDATRTCRVSKVTFVGGSHQALFRVISTKGHRAKNSNHCYFSAVRHRDTHGMSQNSGLQGNP